MRCQAPRPAPQPNHSKAIPMWDIVNAAGDPGIEQPILEKILKHRASAKVARAEPPRLKGLRGEMATDQMGAIQAKFSLTLKTCMLHHLALKAQQRSVTNT